MGWVFGRIGKGLKMETEGEGEGEGSRGGMALCFFDGLLGRGWNIIAK